MHYVTFNASGDLTGCYLQDLHPDHVAAHIEIADELASGWASYRMNSGRTALELAPPVTPAATTPQSIPMLNAHLVLISAGWMQPIRTHLNGLIGPEGEQARAYFDKALTMRRDHPLVLSIPAVLGKTEAEVDALFIQAAALDP